MMMMMMKMIMFVGLMTDRQTCIMFGYSQYV